MTDQILGTPRLCQVGVMAHSNREYGEVKTTLPGQQRHRVHPIMLTCATINPGYALTFSMLVYNLSTAELSVSQFYQIKLERILHLIQ